MLRLKYGIKLVKPTYSEIAEAFSRAQTDYMRKKVEEIILSMPWLCEVKPEDIKFEWKKL